MMDVKFDDAAASAQLSDWARGLSSDVAPTFGEHAGRVADRTRSSLPRRSGALASSVGVRPANDGASVGMGTDHARFVEYGGRGFPHTSTGNYLGPASRGLEPQLATTAAQAAAKSIRSYRWT